MHLPRIASRAFHTPLLLEPRSGLVFLSTLANLVARADVMAPLTPRAFDPSVMLRAGDYEDREPAERTASLPLGIETWARDKAFPSVKNVALIEVDGTLVNKNGTLGPNCGMTGYDGIRTQFSAALADSDIEGIALYVDSPGGEVAGCFDLAETILKARGGKKPIVAIVDGMACSAAYALSCACDRVVASSVGLVGSIGVIVAHASFEEALKKEGVDVTLIYAGKHKADGNPFNKLSAEVAESIQQEIDAIAAQFHDLVAKGRGLTSKSVKALEADSFLAKSALDLKLIDAVMSPADALQGFINALS